MGFGIPSFSDIKNAVTNTASSVTNTVSGAASSVRDFGAAALDKTKELASDGVDLGRRAVNAVRSIDVREAASTVRHGISSGIESARGGIKTGVEWAGQRTHEAADFARDHVPGGDNVVSNAIRGGITVAEDTTRFQLGVVGGVTREVVGLAGTVGELGTTALEMQLSPEASREYGQKILDAGASAASATGNYLNSVAHDPSRLGGDIAGVGSTVKDWGSGQIDRYEQAFKDGKGFETVGMDVGAVATYVVPVGGGPLRGALTATVRGGTEAAVRGGVEATVRGGTEAVVRGGAETAVRGGAESATRGTVEATTRAGTETTARDAATATSKVDEAAATAKEAGSARLRYMGSTPDKFSRTGREVVERMRGEGKILGEGPLLRGNPNDLRLVTETGEVTRIDATIDMAHRTDAVSWWNETGRFFGAKSPEVREFMLDSKNYVLQPRSINRSEGARLGETYQPPVPDFSTLKR